MPQAASQQQLQQQAAISCSRSSNASVSAAETVFKAQPAGSNREPVTSKTAVPGLRWAQVTNLAAVDELDLCQQTFMWKAAAQACTVLGIAQPVHSMLLVSRKCVVRAGDAMFEHGSLTAVHACGLLP